MPNEDDPLSYVDITDAYTAGARMILDQEEWKNLYAEGIEMGRKLERSIITGKPIE